MHTWSKRTCDLMRVALSLLCISSNCFFSWGVPGALGIHEFQCEQNISREKGEITCEGHGFSEDACENHSCCTFDKALNECFYVVKDVEHELDSSIANQCSEHTSEADGESICEGHGFGPEDCDRLTCCSFDALSQACFFRLSASGQSGQSSVETGATTKRRCVLAVLSNGEYLSCENFSSKPDQCDVLDCCYFDKAKHECTRCAQFTENGSLCVNTIDARSKSDALLENVRAQSYVPFAGLICIAAGCGLFCVFVRFHNKSLQAWRKASVLFGCTCIQVWLLINIAATWASYDSKAASGGVLHRIQQRSWNTTTLNAIVGEAQPLYMKIVRTGSDSLRTCLFGDKRALNNLQTLNFITPPRWTRFDEWTNLLYIYGLISAFEVQQYNRSATVQHPPLQVMTALRQPTERALSWYHYVDRGTKLAYPQLSVIDFFRLKDDHIQAFVKDGAIWQLGAHMNPKLRGLPEREALRRAKCLITRMTAVGFFDDMVDDFDLVHARLFPWVEGNWLSRQMFKVGALLRPMQWPADKWFRELTAPEREAVRRVTHLEQELYDFAWWWWKDPRSPVVRGERDPCALNLRPVASDAQPAPPIGRAEATHHARARILFIEVSFFTYSSVALSFIGAGHLCFRRASAADDKDEHTRWHGRFCLLALHLSILALRAILEEFIVIHSALGRFHGNSIEGVIVPAFCIHAVAALALSPVAARSAWAGGSTLVKKTFWPALFRFIVVACQLASIDRVGFPAVATSRMTASLLVYALGVANSTMSSLHFFCNIVGVGVAKFAFPSAKVISSVDHGTPTIESSDSNTYLLGLVMLLLGQLADSTVVQLETQIALASHGCAGRDMVDGREKDTLQADSSRLQDPIGGNGHEPLYADLLITYLWVSVSAVLVMLASTDSRNVFLFIGARSETMFHLLAWCLIATSGTILDRYCLSIFGSRIKDLVVNVTWCISLLASYAIFDHVPYGTASWIHVRWWFSLVCLFFLCVVRSILYRKDQYCSVICRNLGDHCKAME